MATPFDGMATLLAGVFGGSVTITPARGAPVTTTGVVREEIMKAEDASGRVHWAEMPVLKVPAVPGCTLAKGSLVTSAQHPGKTWRVLAPVPSRSPADDKFLTCTMEPVT